MRFVLAAALLLAACSGPPATSETVGAKAAGVLIGDYRAASDTARNITGNVAFERAGIVFDSGVVLYTRVLSPRPAHERMSSQGESYAAAALRPPDVTVELRRVTEEISASRSRRPCGGERTSYVALIYEGRASNVTLLAFAGDQPPGPSATQSRLCAAFAYVAPDGARTRQGVVLQ